MLRALIDASVLLRLPLPSSNPARAVDLIVQAALASVFELLQPPELNVEVANKLATNPYFVSRVDPQRVRILAVALEVVATPLPPYGGPFPTLTRDPDDDCLLAYALRDGADFLVTGDRDLLDLGEAFAPLRIVDPGEFVRELRARGLLDE